MKKELEFEIIDNKILKIKSILRYKNIKKDCRKVCKKRRSFVK